MTEDIVEAFTDGACRGNPGPGGWGAILRYKGREKQLWGGEPLTTNNRMELMAAISALESLTRPCTVAVTTDSEYVKKGITEWVHGWKKRGWKTADRKPVKNADLWLQLDAAAARHRVTWHWVRGGHNGHPENELADQLANRGIDELLAAAAGENDPMRQIVLDTETTGLEPQLDHRIIEIGCVELIDRRPTGRVLHHYLNPDREIDAGAIEVHGLTNEFLADKPRFADVVDELMAFIAGAELVIHNAAFDVGFLNAELARLGDGRGVIADHCGVLDTLELARARHPGQRNSLDALCKRYLIDNSQRTLHGALLDAEILADVYLAMTGGQTALSLGARAPMAREAATAIRRLPAERPRLRVVRAGEAELAAHAVRLAAIDKDSKGNCLWLKAIAPAPEPAPKSG